MLCPSKQSSKSDSQPEKTEHEVVLPLRMGGVHTDPLKQTIHPTINRDSHQTHFKLIMTVGHMRKLLYHKS